MAVIETAVLLLQAKNYSGSGNWLDESGNGHHATPVGSPTFDGTKFTLNGTTQWFTIVDAANLDFAAADSLTVMAWASVVDATPTVTQMLVMKKSTGVTPGWRLFKNPTTATYTFSIADGTIAPSVLTQDASDGVATFMVGRRDVGADNIEAGLDTMSGAPTADTTTTTLVNSVRMTIGTHSADSTFPFNGNIYAVALWRSALTNQQIADAKTELSAVASGGSRSLLLLGVG